MAAGAVTRATLFVYHAVVETAADGDRFAVTAARFRQHLAAIRATTPASAARAAPLAGWWNGGARDGRPVLCFDDGGRSDYERAFPLLAEFGLTAVFFVNTATVGAAGYVSWSELREMQRYGMQIESHGHEHRVLNRLAGATLAGALRISRHILQDRLGTPVQFLAAPYGLWSRRVLEAALCTGYNALCTSHPGRARAGAVVLPRVAATTSTSAMQLQRCCQGRNGGLLWRAGRDRLLWAPRHILLHCNPSWPPPPLPRPAGSRCTS